MKEKKEAPQTPASTGEKRVCEIEEMRKQGMIKLPEHGFLCRFDLEKKIGSRFDGYDAYGKERWVIIYP